MQRLPKQVCRLIKAVSPRAFATENKLREIPLNVFQETLSQFLNSKDFKVGPIQDLMSKTFFGKADFQIAYQFFSKLNTPAKLMICMHALNNQPVEGNVKLNTAVFGMISEKVLELKDDLSVFDLFFVCDTFTKYNLRNSNIIHLFEEKVFEFRSDILSNREKAPDFIKRSVRMLLDAQEIRSELVYEFASMTKLLYRENLMSISKLADLDKTFLKTGSCHGISGVLESSIIPDKMKFRDLVKVCEFLIPIKALSKEKVIAIETQCLKYLRYFLNEQIDLDLVLKDEFQELRIQTSDIIKLFKAFSNSKIHNDGLRDKMLGVVTEYIDSLSNFHYMAAVSAFSKGNYNFSNYKEFYDKVELQAASRLGTLTTNDAIELFLMLANYGKLSVILLNKFGERFAKESFTKISPTFTVKFLEAMSKCTSYFLPKEIIQDEVWKKHIDSIFNNLRTAYLNLFQNFIEPYLESYQRGNFNLFYLPPIVEHSLDLNELFSMKDLDGHFVQAFEIIEFYNNDFATADKKNQALLESIDFPRDKLEKFDPKNLKDIVSLKKLSPDQVIQILWAMMTHKIPVKSYGQVFAYIADNYKLISKEMFIPTFKIAIGSNDQALIANFIEVLKELYTFGDIKYFFPQTQLVYLFWSLLANSIIREIPYKDFETLLESESLIQISPKTHEQLEISKAAAKRIKIEYESYLELDIMEITSELLGINLNYLGADCFEHHKTTLLFSIFLNNLVS